MISKSFGFFLLAALFSVVSCLFFPLTAQAGVTISINEKELALDTAPVVQNGRTMVPTRPVLEAMGGYVTWEPETRAAVSSWQDLELKFPVRNHPLINGIPVIADSKTQLIQGSSFIPLRSMAELLGSMVIWNSTEKTISLKTKAEPGEALAEYFQIIKNRISINTAEKEELVELPGINPELADQIINYRKENGPFSQPEDLKSIFDIDKETFLQLQEKISVTYYEEGTASWYGSRFHGRGTASGETYDKHAYTAAHPTLPFGTYVYVTFLATGRSTLVRINDRGPFIAGRIIDLSAKAAETIGLSAHGIGEVRLEILGKK